MYASTKLSHVMYPVPDGVAADDAASSFVNPLTALGMTETMRLEGHSAIVHTAAASNLGQMLNRLCQADGIPLVNVVRRNEQADLLRAAGAEHVVVSSAGSFADDLTAAITATGATLAFDAIGGGEQVDTLLASMEKASSAGQAFSRYGSDTHKQTVYIYGGLDRSATTLRRTYGMSWVGGWLLTRSSVGSASNEWPNSRPASRGDHHDLRIRLRRHDFARRHARSSGGEGLLGAGHRKKRLVTAAKRVVI